MRFPSDSDVQPSSPVVVILEQGYWLHAQRLWQAGVSISPRLVRSAKAGNRRAAGVCFGTELRLSNSSDTRTEGAAQHGALAESRGMMTSQPCRQILSGSRFRQGPGHTSPPGRGFVVLVAPTLATPCTSNLILAKLTERMRPTYPGIGFSHN